MNYPGTSSFTHSVKGKVVIAFLVGCIALGLAWVVSRTAFRSMLHTVQRLSEPNEKLRIVNNLFRGITQLDQSQKRQALLQKNSSDKEFLKGSKSLRAALDSLSVQYPDNPLQKMRIDSMRRLLDERDKLFLNYLKVRQGLINNSNFSKQIQTLSELILTSAPLKDSTVVTTEQKTTTTFTYPEDSGNAIVSNSNDAPMEKLPEVRSGFLARIFGGKKKPDPPPPAQAESVRKAVQAPTKMVKEEVNIKIDTLALAKQDSIMFEVEKAMQDLEKERRQQSNIFVNREIQLANASNILTSQMLAILQEVEKEVVKQEEQNNLEARDVVNTSVVRISIIMLLFLLIMAVLVYLILTDIARSNAYRRDLEIAKDEAEYHAAAKQRFLSNMSHEIRTPLQSIIGYADLMRHQERPLKKHIDAIFHSSEHLLHIVNEVLDYSRIISGKFIFEQRAFDVRQLLEEVMAVMRPQAEKKLLNMRLRDQISGTGYLTGDPFRLKQVLYNLLGNAIKFTDSGLVTLSVADEAQGDNTLVTFTVADTGKGISAKDIIRVFNQFEQAEGPSSNSAGTGLGLSIVKVLTESQGGKIEVVSEPGQGSTFIVQLPFVAAEEPEPLPSYELDHLPGSFKGKIWVVDDDAFILQLCSSIFEKHRITHTSFLEPQDVLDTPWDDDVTLILADMRMPGINGAELCRQLRKKIPAHVKIYALTAQALPEEREAVVQQGFDGLLMKPFREEELLALLYEQYVPTGSDEDADTDDVEINISALEKMTFGDAEQIKKILERFVTDSGNDIELLCSAAESTNTEQTLLLLHRMAGRTAQVGAGELAAQLRMLEIAMQQKSIQPTDAKTEIDMIVTALRGLLDKVSNTIIPQYDTSPSFYKASYDQY
jgi:signal transduction histidine kinase/CheY-like chemotaxis protein/HPt (histidine-containing phosphotransfer) domain-containing protein